jgi:hypothetical protein
LTLPPAPDTAVLVFGGHHLPRPLRGLPTVDLDAITDVGRVVVVGSPADLATVLTRLLRADRLDIEVGHADGWRAARRARRGSARRVPLIRDESGTVLVSAGEWRAAPGDDALHGEGIVDDTVLFDGQVTGVRIEPTHRPPGLRAAVLSARGRPRAWVDGRAAQLGTPGAQLVRDGVAAPRPVRRSTFYRHTQGWLRVA